MARMAECPGHFGHLEVAKPMFHIGFIKNVLSIMHRVRFNCSKILADEACWMVSASVSKDRSAMLCALECLMGTSSVFMWMWPAAWSASPRRQGQSMPAAWSASLSGFGLVK